VLLGLTHAITVALLDVTKHIRGSQQWSHWMDVLQDEQHSHCWAHRQHALKGDLSHTLCTSHCPQGNDGMQTQLVAKSIPAMQISRRYAFTRQWRPGQQFHPVPPCLL